MPTKTNTAKQAPKSTTVTKNRTVQPKPLSATAIADEAATAEAKTQTYVPHWAPCLPPEVTRDLKPDLFKRTMVMSVGELFRRELDRVRKNPSLLSDEEAGLLLMQFEVVLATTREVFAAQEPQLHGRRLALAV